MSWPADSLSWADFRGRVLGATDPSTAPVGSVRRAILDNYEELGLASKPNTGDNGVHASASPFEAMAERVNWLSALLIRPSCSSPCGCGRRPGRCGGCGRRVRRGRRRRRRCRCRRRCIAGRRLARRRRRRRHLRFVLLLVVVVVVVVVAVVLALSWRSGLRVRPGGTVHILTST